MNGHVQDRLAAYVGGDLGAVESDRIHAHLESCPECRMAHMEHLRFEFLLEEATCPPRRTDSLWPAVADRLHPTPPFTFTLRLAGGMAVAAAVGVVMSLSIPASPSPRGVETDPWTHLGYTLVDSAPMTLDVIGVGDPQ